MRLKWCKEGWWGVIFLLPVKTCGTEPISKKFLFSMSLYTSYSDIDSKNKSTASTINYRPTIVISSSLNREKPHKKRPHGYVHIVGIDKASAAEITGSLNLTISKLLYKSMVLPLYTRLQNLGNYRY